MARIGGTIAALVLTVASAAMAQQGGDRDADDWSAPPGTGIRAGGAQQRPHAPDALLGDWWGVKKTLGDAGIKPVIGYKGEFAANVSGGTRHDATLVGQLDLGVTLDTARLFDHPGGTVQVSVTYRHGPLLDARAGLNVAQQVQEVYGRGQTTRLTELWYQQSAAAGRLILKVGRMPAGDFNTFDCEFQNLTFCGSPAGNITGSYWLNWPIAQWMGWAKVRSDRFYLKAGLNEDNRRNLDDAFFVSRCGAKGVIYHLEAGWTPVFGAGALPGRYQAGGWWNTSSDADVLDGPDRRPFALTGLSPRQRSGQYGWYVQGEQQLSGAAKIDPVSGVITRKRGFNAFFNVIRNDPATSTLLDQEAVGLYLSAPFAGRPKDQIGFGVGRTHYNWRAALAAILADPAAERPRDEYAAELYYGFAAIPGLVLRPNLQYVVDPGGLRRAIDVVVLGFRFDANL